MNHKHHTASASWYKSPAVLGLLVILGVAGAFILVQHWDHAAPYSLWLLILATPLLHIFMHSGHGAHGGHDSGKGQGGGCCGGHSGDTAPKKNVKQPVGQLNAEPNKIE